MEHDHFRIQYQDNIGRAERLRDVIIVQLLELFNSNNVTLGVPIESRIKTWSSISEKIDRKELQLTSLLDLQDLIGIRSILLFKRDLTQVDTLISKHLTIISSEDTGDRLSESEFGYQSRHYIVKIPEAWLSLPSLVGLNEFFIELQVRTLAQHIWAAASHKLQYKQEAGVPPPVRRAINRVSALLETVDLEFERVLNEREEYVEVTQKSAADNEALNVDNLARILMETFPEENWFYDEPYADLFKELTQLGVTNTNTLREIINKHLAKTLKFEKSKMNDPNVKLSMQPDTEAFDRYERGVFYTHAGLARTILRSEFGAEGYKAAKSEAGTVTKKSRLNQKRTPIKTE